uniref:lysoplasmalogenase n=1 Tax=Sphenodon punctatus TaxID=8508 RepID=A0A8D0GD00_SPHPU
MDILETDAQYRRKLAANTWGLLIRLLPFGVSCALYFLFLLPEPDPFSALVKCLPVLSLTFFVVAQSLSKGQWDPYARNIFWGLLCSAVGDACLVRDCGWGLRGSGRAGGQGLRVGTEGQQRS